MRRAADLSQRMIRGAQFLERIPALAISGEDSAVDLILYEVLRLFVHEVRADIGQINLFPRGGRVEKVCILKDRKPWLRKEIDLHLFDPYHGFTGQVMATGGSILVKNIWASGTREEPNPFLEMIAEMSDKYIKEIKEPIACIIIAPIKRGRDIFCTLELGRYKDRRPFSESEKELVDAFAARYGSLVMDYILDVKNRIAINTAHTKLLSLGRLVASRRPVDYRDAVEAYIRLSAADIGFAFFKAPESAVSDYRTLVWKGEEIREILLREFIPSADSILRDGLQVSSSMEGQEGDARLTRFQMRIQGLPALTEEERRYILGCLSLVKSYVAYPLHTLGQDLGAIVLGSRRPQFWQFLHMNPFLALYNSLLKSFLLNERVIHSLCNVSMKVHNPGFYCLGGLKGALATRYPSALQDPEVSRALEGLEKLLDELHSQGTVLRCRKKNIHLVCWLQSFVNRKSAAFPGIDFQLRTNGTFMTNPRIGATEEQLEAIFENLFANSMRAIASRQRDDPCLTGVVEISVHQQLGRIKIMVQDNGAPYITVSGRGVPQIRDAMHDLRGTVRIYTKAYRVLLGFPCLDCREKEEER